MNIQILLLCSLCIITTSAYTQETETSQEENSAPASISFTTKKRASVNKKKNFLFQFENKDLVDIINLIAAEKGINIVLPQKPPIDAKITFYVPEKITIDEAWNLLYTILDVAGYAIKPQGDMFAIIRIPETPGSMTAEPMPTFVGTSFDDLPDGDMRIRYIYYLTNMKVPNAPGASAQENELAVVLNHILSGGTTQTGVPGATTFVTDVNANAVILAGKADTIKGALAVIKQLDKGGFHEKMEIVKLKHTTAADIKKLFAENLLKASSSPTPIRGDTRKPSETYFSPNTRIIDESRTNSLIVVGRAQAVDRIKDFIETYIDLAPDSGKSILHVYTLLYLDAQQMVPVLERVIGTKDASGTGQSRADGKPLGGPERFFDTVIIKSDRPDSAQSNMDDKNSSKYQYSGGNRLIIAARNDDWKRIKGLLEQLDKPFPQVFIEVLIADVNIDDLRQLGTQTRNLHACLPSQLNIQSAQLAAPIVDTATSPGTIAGDLLANTIPVTNGSGTTNLAALAAPGSAIISLNDKDGQTWSLLQLLRSFNATKIISHPHVVSINNKPASISIGETRLVLGEAALGTQAANIKQDPIKALLEVKITPRISADNVINLNVDISINTFAANTPGFQNTINTREVHTNANIRNKSILALGGLVSTQADDAEIETPLLAKVPILGWFFKNRRSDAKKENLTVFISPTIIMPNLRGGIHQHAKDYIDLAKQYATEGSLFDSLKDPVTRFFFKTGTVETAKTMDEFVKDDESLNGSEIRPKNPGRKLQKRQGKARSLAKSENHKQLKDIVQVNEENPLLTSTRNKKKRSAQVA
jgi:type II secretion system protein D